MPLGPYRTTTCRNWDQLITCDRLVDDAKYIFARSCFFTVFPAIFASEMSAMPMRRCFLVATWAILLIYLALSEAQQSKVECIKDSHRCVHNTECCSGCCVEEKCSQFSDSCSIAQSPCAVHACPPGKMCYLEQVQCIQAPCPPVPACKDQDYDDYN